MTINSLGVPATPAPAGDTNPTPEQAAQNRALSRAVQLINNSSLTSQNRQLSISLDPATKITVAKVVDPVSGEVFDQVPAEYVLRLAAYMDAENAQKQAAQINLKSSR